MVPRMTRVLLLLACLGLTAGLAHGQVRLGNETLAAEGYAALQGKRVALLTNPTGVNRQLVSTLDSLRRAPGVRLVALFAPEHGIYGDIPAGKEFSDAKDPRTGLTVFSLYGPGPVRKPTRKMLQGIDVLVYDLQDTGCRSYTFISTMGMAMEACGEAGVEFMVLDRPNPLGGLRVEGLRAQPAWRSMVGRWPIPYVYGLTCGELAAMINGEGWTTNRCKVKVIPMSGWQRRMAWRDTGLPWVPPSPHVPQGDSPLYQVATGMLGELGGLSIGVGYTLPFQCLAAPWLNAREFCATLNAFGLRGVRFVPITYTPYYGAFKGQSIQGAQIFITDPAEAPLTAINLYALDAVRSAGKRNLVSEALLAGKSLSMFDKVNGTDATRKALAQGKSPASIISTWRADEESFRARRQKYLLYP